MNQEVAARMSSALSSGKKVRFAQRFTMTPEIEMAIMEALDYSEIIPLLDARIDSESESELVIGLCDKEPDDKTQH